MEFNTSVKKEILPILKEFGFRVMENSENIFQLASHKVRMNIIYNKFEESFLVEIGLENDILYPLNDDVLKYILGDSLHIENITLDTFIGNLMIFIKDEKGKDILNGKITILKDFITKESLSYTSNIIKKQVLLKADSAWINEDYHSFIHYIDELDSSETPQSYLLKYNIAKKKM